MFNKVCIGGTFDILHKGHKVLIDKAFSITSKNGLVTIGLTTDRYTVAKIKNAFPFDVRKQKLIEYLKTKGYENYEIIPIEDKYGPTLSEDFDAIVVSSETRKNAEEINRKRKQFGLKPLKIIEISIVLAEDNLPISSSRIKNGIIDEDGKRLNIG